MNVLSCTVRPSHARQLYELTNGGALREAAQANEASLLQAASELPPDRAGEQFVFVDKQDIQGMSAGQLRGYCRNNPCLAPQAARAAEKLGELGDVAASRAGAIGWGLAGAGLAVAGGLAALVCPPLGLGLGAAGLAGMLASGVRAKKQSERMEGLSAEVDRFGEEARQSAMGQLGSSPEARSSRTAQLEHRIEATRDARGQVTQSYNEWFLTP